MLPRLPLDDRSFADIVQEARQKIPYRFPEWTDENAHDPGITLLELFAWLSEMQQYYLSRIPERNVRKFLDLLGIERREAQCAVTEAAIGGVTRSMMLPVGTKLLAEDQVFETTETVRLLPLEIERIITRTDRETSDRTASHKSGNSVFYAFGPDAREGSVLYIALDREPPVGEEITLSVLLKDRADHWLSQRPDNVVPSARVAWRSYSYDGMFGASWAPIEIVEDETVQLTYSGRLTFRISRPLKPIVVHPAADKPRYWLSCTLVESGYEQPPRIDRLLLNTVRVRQQDTQCEKREFDCDGTPGFAVHTDSFLARYGQTRVQVREADGRWRDWRVVPDWEGIGATDRCCTIERLDDFGDRVGIVVHFGDGVRGAIPPGGVANIRLIHYAESFVSKLEIGRSNGLPHQSFLLQDIPCRQSDVLRLQVGVPDETGELVWEDWQPVRDFDHSGPLSPHFVYNPDTGELTFGDDEQGAIPPAHHSPNLYIVSCRTGGGSRGNIKPGLLSQWVEPKQQAWGLTVTNVGYATGGTEVESLQGCLARTEAEWGLPYCAVTDEDYRRIALSTPGLRVARVHVIPGYAPGRSNAPAAVTVVVVPDGAGQTPMPSKGYLETVAKHLDERRLITTEIHVTAPAYIRVTVQATVVVEPHFMDEAHRIEQVLRQLLSPLDRPDQGIRGWPFGKTVYKGDIYSAIAKIKGVAYVQDLWLDAEGNGARKNAGGDIELPPNGLVYSGEHRIELISITHM
jgi:hypothetical protein